MDENEEQFKKYEMIRTLDGEGKGYVNLEEFLQFFVENSVANENCQKLPSEFFNREEWKTAIDENY
jgi:Ca2+-binding EF-hand superfamily protein